MDRMRKILAIALSLLLVTGMIPAHPLTVDAKAKLKLNKTKKTILVSESYKLAVKNTPKKSKVTIKWSSADKKVAVVTSKGTVYGVGAGSTSITAKIKITTKNKKKKKTKTYKKTCTITVKEPAAETDKQFDVTGTKTVKIKNIPSKATVTWTTADKNYATVTKKAQTTAFVKAIATGAVQITAKVKTKKNSKVPSKTFSISFIAMCDVGTSDDASGGSGSTNTSLKVVSGSAIDSGTAIAGTRDSNGKEVFTIAKAGTYTIAGGTASAPVKGAQLKIVATGSTVLNVDGAHVDNSAFASDTASIISVEGTTVTGGSAAASTLDIRTREKSSLRGGAAARSLISASGKANIILESTGAAWGMELVGVSADTTSNSARGISVDNGSITIKSGLHSIRDLGGDGINASGDIRVVGGDITISGCSGDGIETRGRLTLEGGNTTIYTHVISGSAASAVAFNARSSVVSGATVFAAESAQHSSSAPGSGSQPYVRFTAEADVAAGSVLRVADSSAAVGTTEYSIPNACRSFFFSSPKLVKGTTYYLKRSSDNVAKATAL